jgi:hypothetical protein
VEGDQISWARIRQLPRPLPAFPDDSTGGRSDMEVALQRPSDCAEREQTFVLSSGLESK